MLDSNVTPNWKLLGYPNENDSIEVDYEIWGQCKGIDRCLAHLNTDLHDAPAGCAVKANARLMVTAPLMLETLKKASTCASIPDYVMNLIKDAIVEAEGKET